MDALWNNRAKLWTAITSWENEIISKFKVVWTSGKHALYSGHRDHDHDRDLLGREFLSPLHSQSFPALWRLCVCVFFVLFSHPGDLTCLEPRRLETFPGGAGILIYSSGCISSSSSKKNQEEIVNGLEVIAVHSYAYFCCVHSLGVAFNAPLTKAGGCARAIAHARLKTRHHHQTTDAEHNRTNAVSIQSTVAALPVKTRLSDFLVFSPISTPMCARGPTTRGVKSKWLVAQCYIIAHIRRSRLTYDLSHHDKLNKIY